MISVLDLLCGIPHSRQSSMFSTYGQDWGSDGGYERFAVELETDGGETGLAINECGGKHAAGLVDRHYCHFAEGVDPWEINKIWKKIHRAKFPTRPGFMTHNTMADIELVMRDRRGSITSLPVKTVPGGKDRDDLKRFATPYFEVMEHFADEGLIGVKVPIHHGPSDGRASMVRRLVGLYIGATHT